MPAARGAALVHGERPVKIGLLVLFAVVAALLIREHAACCSADELRLAAGRRRAGRAAFACARGAPPQLRAGVQAGSAGAAAGGVRSRACIPAAARGGVRVTCSGAGLACWRCCRIRARWGAGQPRPVSWRDGLHWRRAATSPCSLLRAAHVAIFAIAWCVRGACSTCSGSRYLAPSPGACSLHRLTTPPAAFLVRSSRSTCFCGAAGARRPAGRGDRIDGCLLFGIPRSRLAAAALLTCALPRRFCALGCLLYALLSGGWWAPRTSVGPGAPLLAVGFATLAVPLPCRHRPPHVFALEGAALWAWARASRALPRWTGRAAAGSACVRWGDACHRAMRRSPAAFWRAAGRTRRVRHAWVERAAGRVQAATAGTWGCVCAAR